MGVTPDPWIATGGVGILTILILLLHEQQMSLHYVCVFFNFFD